MPTFSRMDPPSTRQLAREMVVEEIQKAKQPQIGNKSFAIALLVAVVGFAALIYLLM